MWRHATYDMAHWPNDLADLAYMMRDLNITEWDNHEQPVIQTRNAMITSQYIADLVLRRAISGDTINAIGDLINGSSLRCVAINTMVSTPPECDALLLPYLAPVTGGAHWELAVAEQTSAIVYFLGTADGGATPKAHIIRWMQHHDLRRRVWGSARWKVPLQGHGPECVLGVMLFRW